MKEILYYQNRIDLLSGRSGVNNTRIINKLKRKIRALEKKNAQK